MKDLVKKKTINFTNTTQLKKKKYSLKKINSVNFSRRHELRPFEEIE